MNGLDMPENVPPLDPFQNHQPQNDPRTSPLFTGSARPELIDLQKSSITPPPIKSSLPQASARRLERMKHSKLRRNILIVISILIGILLALIATDTLKLGTGPRPVLQSTSQALGVTTESTATVAGEQVEKTRVLTHEDPLRVYIGGDSLVGSYGDSLASALGQTGVIKATYDSRPSSGLMNTSFFDWNSHTKQVIKRYNPEVIVFMIGTNDASIVSANPTGYKTDYTKKVNDYLDIAKKVDTKVYFVLAPAMKEPRLDKNVNKLNDVITDVAGKRNVKVFDSSTILSPAGKFVTSIISGSKSTSARADDGVHITNEGGKLLAIALHLLLDNDLHFSQYPAAKAIKATKVPGCCTTPKSVPTATDPIYSSKTTSTSNTTPTTTTTTATSTSMPDVDQTAVVDTEDPGE